MTPFALSDGQMEEARQLYAVHQWPAADIAEQFGVSETAVMSALRHLGVQMRSRYTEPPPVRVKQCARCLHFLPLALFGGRDATRVKLASWCNDCTNQPPDQRWNTNPLPLAQAINNHWRA